MSVTVAVGPYFPFMNRCRGTNACWVVIVSRHAKDTFIWCSSSWHGVLSLTSDCLAKPKVNYLICALWHFKCWFVSWGCVLTLRFFFYPPGWQLGNNRTRRGWISSGSLKKRSHLLETVFFFFFISRRECIQKRMWNTRTLCWQWTLERCTSCISTCLWGKKKKKSSLFHDISKGAAHSHTGEQDMVSILWNHKCFI